MDSPPHNAQVGEEKVLINLLEILIITMILNYLLSFFWNTRAMDLVFGLFAFLISFILVKEFHLPVLEKIMLHIANVAMIGIFILFQPELRLALSKLSFKSRKYREMTEFDQFLNHIGNSIYRLAEKKVGALVVLENQDSLEEYANKAVKIGAKFSAEVLESIFVTTTPLHDGAVIIRETTILSAATILPLADDSSQLVKSMGTRHRAGLGISQLTDALVIVVSEENGKVSIARDGIMTRGVKIDRFKGIIRSIFQSPKTTKLNLFRWFKE